MLCLPVAFVAGDGLHMLSMWLWARPKAAIPTRGGASAPFHSSDRDTFMKISRALLAGVFVVAATTSAVQARPWAEIKENGTLIAATGGDLKPFNYFEGKKLTGFEVELAEAIAAKMGVKVEWKVITFDALLAGLQRDRWDLAISSHGVTEERAKVVDFSDNHYCGGATIVAVDPDINKVADLAGKTVAVQTGTTFLDYITRNKLAGSVRNFPQDRDARMAMTTRRADAWVTDKFVAMEAIKLVPEARMRMGEEVFVERMAAAVKKGNTELLAAFNKGLADVMADGTYESISKKYFGNDIRCKSN